MLIVGVVITQTSERSVVDDRLGRYLEDDVDLDIADDPNTPITDWLNSRVEGSERGGKIAKELARADLKFKPGEYVGLVIVVCFLLAIIGYYYGGGGIPGYLFGFLGAILGPLLPRAYVKRKQKQRLVNFNDQLPDMLSLMVNGLRAGYSQMQAMESVGKELPEPISGEFARVVRESQLGLPIQEALDNLLRRIPSADLDLIITAINIQREVGGNLAEILDIIAYTIRERIRIKKEIEVLVTQVLYSGRILALLPIALTFFLYGVNPSYIGEFWKEGNRLCGIPLLICGVLMIIAGYYAMTRVADIEV
jgi:tight adherence protein B